MAQVGSGPPPGGGGNQQNRQMSAQDTAGLIDVDKNLERAKREIQLWREELFGLQSPNKAALYSAALPGLGQVYNKKYWKVPLLGVGAVVTGYFINFNNRRYLLFRRSYFAEIDDDPETENLVPRFNADGLQRNLEYFRRNRDLLFITGGIMYLINIVDAHVDAHLFSFDVTDDLALNIRPDAKWLPNGAGGPGITIAIQFK
jgi:hypothetical protein